MQDPNSNKLSKNWSWGTFGWGIICFLLLSTVNGIFTYLFDVVLFDVKIGYAYMYFAVFFFALILYFFITKLRVSWLGTLTFGLMGLIGIPIEYWLEYLVTPSLKSIWGAFGWGIIYLFYGLGADVSLILMRKIRNRKFAVFCSGLLFSTGLLVLSIIPLVWFYNSVPTEANYLTYAWFLMPFGILQGGLGALLGFLIVNPPHKESRV